MTEGRCILEVFQVVRSRYKSRPSAVTRRRNAITRTCTCVRVCVRQMSDARFNEKRRKRSRTGNCFSLRNFVGIDARSSWSLGSCHPIKVERVSIANGKYPTSFTFHSFASSFLFFLPFTLPFTFGTMLQLGSQGEQKVKTMSI